MFNRLMVEGHALPRATKELIAAYVSKLKHVCILSGCPQRHGYGAGILPQEQVQVNS